MAAHWARRLPRSPGRRGALGGSSLCPLIAAAAISLFTGTSRVHADAPREPLEQTAPGVETPPTTMPRAPASSATGDQSSSADATPPEYERAIDQAVDEHDRGHFEEAREHFRTAHEIHPNARTSRGLGKAEFELRNYGESVRHLTAALSSRVRPLTPELREEVQTILERARAYVGEVHVAVQPGTASVSVDGVKVATGPQAALALHVGDHVLEFHANGRVPERRHIRVHGRDQINIQVVLAPPESRPLSAGPEHSDREQVPVRRRWWVWTAAGAIAAGAATAVALSLRRDDGEKPASGGTSGVVLPAP